MNSVAYKYFKEISAIPRASYDERRISDYIVSFAVERNLRYIQDELYNVIIFKPASPSFEGYPTLMLQAHTDMVAEKNKDCCHDFSVDPLDLYEENGFLHAKGTTLGADDGVGVSYMLALLDDETLEHPDLECVFTVQEEVGLSGAAYLDTSVLKASMCIGLDGSGEIKTDVSSSGGVRSCLSRKLSFETVNKPGISLSVRGLLGGHSGGAIDKERANAIKLLAQILKEAREVFPELQLSEIDGGLKINAIIREADVLFTLNDLNQFKTWFKTVGSEIKHRYALSDPNINFIIEQKAVCRLMSHEDSTHIIDLLYILPYGVRQKSLAIENVVSASANIGLVSLEDDVLSVRVSLRATQTWVLDHLIREVTWLSEKTGFDSEFTNKYPGWDFDENSKLRKHLFETFASIYHQPMKSLATHGGLELGIWKEKMPDLDIVNLGPIMYDIHTPDERLDIASFERTYDLLKAVISTLE